MTPETILKENIETATNATKTYKLDKNKKVIVGMIDGRDAVEQAVYCHLNVERFQWIILSWNIGIETMDLYGEPVMWVCSEIERRIKECLDVIETIELVDNFEFEISKRKILCKFTVKSIYGEFDAEKGVEL